MVWGGTYYLLLTTYYMLLTIPLWDTARPALLGAGTAACHHTNAPMGDAERHQHPVAHSSLDMEASPARHAWPQNYAGLLGWVECLFAVAVTHHLEVLAAHSAYRERRRPEVGSILRQLHVQKDTVHA